MNPLFAKSGSRITPAGAGKTLKGILIYGNHWDHPRRCGENHGDRKATSARDGSPPQVRGKPVIAAATAAAARITPAGAGKTVYRCLPAERYTDHPRRCGENTNMVVDKNSACGSPPQVRGKLRNKTPTIVIARITPAGAGKTYLEGGFWAGHWDHPRRCGENRR